MRTKEQKIKDKSLVILSNFFGLNPKQSSIKEFGNRLQQAKLGMSFFKEINVHDRANVSHKLKVCVLISENKKQMREYIKKSMPKYFPIKN